MNPRDEKCRSVSACQHESQVTLPKSLPAVEAAADKARAVVAGFITVASILPAARELAPNFSTSNIFHLTFVFLLCYGHMQACRGARVPQYSPFCPGKRIFTSLCVF